MPHLRDWFQTPVDRLKQSPGCRWDRDRAETAPRASPNPPGSSVRRITTATCRRAPVKTCRCPTFPAQPETGCALNGEVTHPTARRVQRRDDLRWTRTDVIRGRD